VVPEILPELHPPVGHGFPPLSYPSHPLALALLGWG
jgi:hypothetical protein